MPDARGEKPPVAVSGVELRWLTESGFALLEMGRWTDAEDVFRGAAVLASNTCVPLIGLGRALMAVGRPEDAIRAYLDAVDVAGAYGEEASLARSSLAEALMVANRFGEARRMAADAISINPSGNASAFARALLSGLESGVFGAPREEKRL